VVTASPMSGDTGSMMLVEASTPARRLPAGERIWLKHRLSIVSVSFDPRSDHAGFVLVIWSQMRIGMPRKAV